MAVLLAGGVAQAAPPTPVDEASQKPRLRFLSLAEARAIALEQASLNDYRPPRPGAGLDSQIDVIQPVSLKGSHSHYRVLTGLTPQEERIIRITGVRRDGRAELERTINQVLLNVENAYWNLYGSYWQLHSREQGMRHAYETWKLVGARYRDDKASRAAFAQAGGQYNLFRSQRLQALDNVLDNERQLRAIMGMKIEDGHRLVPCDAPSRAEKKPDWDKAVAEALKNRPELRMARAAVVGPQLKYLVVRKVLLPIVRVVDPKQVEAFDNWSPPPGIRHLSADFIPPGPPWLREAHLQITRAYDTLIDQELKAERFLGLYYRRMSSYSAQIKAARAQHEAFAEQLRLRSDSYRDGNKDAALDLLLEAQRFEADALATEYQAIVCYNNALVGWEYAKGAIINYAHVVLAEEPSAGCQKVRAVVYERRRTRERMRGEPGEEAHSLLSLWKDHPPLQTAEPVSSAGKDDDTDVRLIGWTVSDVLPPATKKAKRMP
jgi:hypothetical protein